MQVTLRSRSSACCECPWRSGIVGFLFLGRLLQGASETTFLLLLIMLAKGWTICCRKISARGRVKIAIFGTLYACVWVGLDEYCSPRHGMPFNSRNEGFKMH